MHDYVIVGAGIIGLSTGLHLTRRYPHASVLVLEKEARIVFHQSGHNSGVIHSGIYYKPGSKKARLCPQGARSMVAFCQEHGIDHDVCGKVIVATHEAELPQLETLYQRGKENGVDVTRLQAAEVNEIEPYVSCLGGIKVASTGIVDYKAVGKKYAELIVANGGEIRLQTQVLGIDERAEGIVVETSGDTVKTRYLINCGGLHSDRIAKRADVNPNAQIVPFRGEYFELIPERRHLVKNLIYPVPKPEFPFLGVHFTRMIDGTVHAGPNAVLSFKREGYNKTDFDFKDLCETLAYPGVWKLAAKYGRDGLKELLRSISKRAFTRSLQRLIPDVRADDIIPTHAGVRAQAITADGGLVDDFLIVKGANSTHVCNAPSPAATCSIPIGQEIVDQVPAV